MTGSRSNNLAQRLRRSFVFIIYLAFGALATVATSWACVWWRSPVSNVTAQESLPTRAVLVRDLPKVNSYWLAHYYREPGVQRMVVSILPRHGDRERPSTLDRRWLEPFTTEPDDLHPDLLDRVRQSAGMRNIFFPAQIEEVAGWPFLAMRYRFTRFGGMDEWKTDGIEISPRAAIRSSLTRSNLSYWYRRALPTRIAWNGFIKNTLFYALLLALPVYVLIRIWRVAHWLRSINRVRRNRCMQCGYDLRNLPMDHPCPECAWSRECGEILPPHSMWSRLAWELPRAICVGFIATVAIAWLAAWQQPFPTQYTANANEQIVGDMDIDVGRWDGPASIRYAVAQCSAEPLPPNSSIGRIIVGFQFERSTHAMMEEVVPEWILKRLAESEWPTDDDSLHLIDTYGWPYPSSTVILTGELDRYGLIPRSANDGIEVPFKYDAFRRMADPPAQSAIAVLPVKPLWPGFAINIAFFAMLWMLVIGCAIGVNSARSPQPTTPR